MLEMLRDRGYIVTNEEVEFTLKQFRDRYENEEVDVEGLLLRANHKDDPNHKIMVHFFEPRVVRVKCIQELLNTIRHKEEPLSRVILVPDKKMTKQAKSALELFPCKVEIFQITELLVNITKHELQPKYEVLGDEEKQMLLEKYKLSELPRMLETDPVARYYACEKGTVLKITYNGEATETDETYRIVS